jgi:hypothetical protein
MSHLYTDVKKRNPAPVGQPFNMIGRADAELARLRRARGATPEVAQSKSVVTPERSAERGNVVGIREPTADNLFRRR